MKIVCMKNYLLQLGNKSPIAVKAVHNSNILRRQFKVKDLEIFYNALLVNRLGNRHCSMLDLEGSQSDNNIL